MRLVTFLHHGHQHAGVVVDETVISLKSAGFADVIAVLTGGAEALETITNFAANAPADAVSPVSSVKLCAPIPKPGKIICVGLNYRDHALEAKMEIPTRPTIFSKYGNTVIGPGDQIILPKNSEKPDYEAEFAFVIGKSGRHIKAENWKEYVFGYMNLNDVSARDVQMAGVSVDDGQNVRHVCSHGTVAGFGGRD